MPLAKIRVNDKNHEKIGRIGPLNPIIRMRSLREKVSRGKMHIGKSWFFGQGIY